MILYNQKPLWMLSYTIEAHTNIDWIELVQSMSYFSQPDFHKIIAVNPALMTLDAKLIAASFTLVLSVIGVRGVSIPDEARGSVVSTTISGWSGDGDGSGVLGLGVGG